MLKPILSNKKVQFIVFAMIAISCLESLLSVYKETEFTLLNTVIPTNALTIITMITQVVIATTVFFIFLQLKEEKKKSRENHDSKRREFAINLLQEWQTLNRGGEMYMARRLVKELHRQDKKNLIEGKQFKIDSSLKSLIEASLCLSLKNCDNNCSSCTNIFEVRTYKNEKNENDNIEYLFLKEKSVIILRHMVVTYFNALESIASAYKHNIADREILAEQFLYITRSEENFISLINDFELNEGLPCIQFFILDAQGKKDDGKKELGK